MPEGRSEAAEVLDWSSAEVAGLGGARAKGPAAPMRELFYSLSLRGVLGAFFFFFFNSFLRKKNDKNFKADFSCYRKTNIKALPLSGSLWPCLCVLPARCWAEAWPAGQDPSTSAPSDQQESAQSAVLGAHRVIPRKEVQGRRV